MVIFNQNDSTHDSEQEKITNINQDHNGAVVSLFKTVVEGGYCIGCGACASVSDSPIKMALDDYGRFQATLDPAIDITTSKAAVISVCPFSGVGPNEDEIGRELFDENCKYHDRIGYNLATYAGFVAEDGFRENGSSGGMGTWILTELFNHGLIDRVIHVGKHESTDADQRLFSYQVSSSIKEIRAGAKSRYYPIEMSGVLDIIRHRPGRYAIVGVPCFIKAIRLLAKENPVIREQIRFCIGLVCGHLKSSRFSEMFAWQCEIAPRDVLSINFRKKIPGKNANKYGVEVVGLRNNQEVSITKPNHEFYGYLWGQGFFKYQACDYCDDVVAETADITIGDAWLPQYVKDSEGTNVIVLRHPLIQDLIERAMSSGRLHLDQISADDVAESQDAGLRHRREGLAYRLHLKDQAGLWRPSKRVEPESTHLNPRLKKIHQLRSRMAIESHLAFEKALEAGSFVVFKDHMEPLVGAYNALYKSKGKRWISSIKKLIMNLTGLSV